MRRDCSGVRPTSQATVVLTVASAVVLLLGLAATRHSESPDYGTPWVAVMLTVKPFG